MNELKPEDVMEEAECCGYATGCTDCVLAKYDGSLCIVKKALALLREKDAEIDMLKKRLQHLFISKTIQAYDELDTHTKEYVKDIYSFDTEMNCERERVELDVKASKDKFAEETIEWCRKKLKFGKYQTMGLSGKRLEGYEAAMKAVMSYMHSLKSKDDFPNCKISGCEAARKDCHIDCPYGKGNKNENS